MIDIDLINKIVFNNNCVILIKIDFDNDKYNLLLKLAKSERGNASCSIIFYDVSNLKIKDFGGGLTQFMHAKIQKTESGYDRAKYIFEELEYESISFSFSNANIVSNED